MTYVWKIGVPGQFRPDMAFLDIETRKVPTNGYVMESGEPLRNRWQVFLAGIAINGEINLVEGTDQEIETLWEIARVIKGRPVLYEATRDFDEMVLKGRFTNARRAHQLRPFFPVMPDANKLQWRNARKAETHPLADIRSPNDLPGKDVPKAWTDGRGMAVLIHNLRDVAEMIAVYGSPDAGCRDWCINVLNSDAIARGVIGESVVLPIR